MAMVDNVGTRGVGGCKNCSRMKINMAANVMQISYALESRGAGEPAGSSEHLGSPN
jgi:hypothetical protein